jgi:serine/threonine protein kinase
MTVKDPKPGKYKPKCRKCGAPFSITVSADSAEPLVEKLPDPQSTFAPATAQQTVIAQPIGSVEATMAPGTATAVLDAAPVAAQRTQAGSIDATLAPGTISGTDATMAPSAATGARGYEVTAPGLARDATLVELRRASAGSAMPEVLGGYKLIKELGRGAMGAVYLAKQLSLDRNVALKVIQAQWATNPAFVARFTREAYAAAQLTHHNVVQIYDLGSQGETNFFSMEFVSGESLADRVQKLGKLDAEEAVGYVLQAARGLKFAHSQGMVHRDIKPANLMLNDHGVVKVADLGLVKTPQLLEELPPDGEASPGPTGPGSSLAAATAEVTLANVAMGTPAYMAPEQAENAAGVDHRADIYSLGCTLYVLLTGRAPFEGATAIEVITKHRTEPIVRPEAIVKRIPPQLSEIVLKMVAKRPEDRYQNLPEVIAALEGFLGIKSSGAYSPQEADVQVLEECLNNFNSAGLAKLRSVIPLGFLAGWAGLFVLLLLAGLMNWFAWQLAGMVGATGAAAVTGYFVIGGLGARTYLFDRVRAYLLNLRWTDWLTVAAAVLISLPILWLTGWLIPVILGGVIGLGLGAALYYTIDKPLAAARKEPFEKIEGLLKSLRIKGVDETALQQFVVKYSGDHWEEFYETLFGYEAKLQAREEVGKTEQGRRKQKFRPWRDGVIRSMEARLRADREERDRKHLQKVEEAGLKARGVDPARAKKEAAQMADALVDEAAEIREQKPAAGAGQTVDPKVIAAAKRSKQLKMLAEARSGKYESKRQRLGLGLVTGPLGFALSGKIRFLAGALLIALCVMWMNQNGIVGQIEKVTGDQVGSVDAKAMGVLGTFAQVLTGEKKTEPLKVLPLVNSFAAGIAGLILAILGLFRGWKMSFFAWPAALVALFVPTYIGYGIAAGLAIVGLLLGRTAEE